MRCLNAKRSRTNAHVLLALALTLSAGNVKLPGMELEMLDGRRLTELRAIIPKDDGLVVIDKRGNESFLDFRQLDEKTRAKYKYDPAKAEQARQRKLNLRKKRHEAREKKLRRKKSRRNHILDHGEPHVVVKKITLAPKSGGFIYLEEDTVIPVLYEKIVVEDEVFDAPMKRLKRIDDVLRGLKHEMKEIMRMISDIPTRLEKLRKERQTIYEHLAEIMNSGKSVTQKKVVDENGNLKDVETIVTYDPAVASRITELKRRDRELKKRIRNLEKTDINEMRGRINSLNRRYVKLLNRSSSFRDRMTFGEEAGSAGETNETQGAGNKKIKKKLELLKEMLEENLISKEDYEKKKQQLLLDFQTK